MLRPTNALTTVPLCTPVPVTVWPVNMPTAEETVAFTELLIVVPPTAVGQYSVGAPLPDNAGQLI
jgi:hypothetical protein